MVPEIAAPGPLFWRNVMSNELIKFEKSINGLRSCASTVTFPHISLPRERYSRLACIFTSSMMVPSAMALRS